MARNSQSSASTSAPGWTPVQVALLASICLIFGLIAGYYIPAGKAASSPLLRATANAPIDDEPESDEEREAVARSKAWFKQRDGQGISHKEVLSDFGLTPDDLTKNRR